MANPTKRAELEYDLAEAQKHQAEATKFIDKNAAHIADLKAQLGVVDDDDYQLTLVSAAGRRQTVNAKGATHAIAAQAVMRKMPGWTVEHDKTVKLADLQDVAAVPELVPDEPPAPVEPVEPALPVVDPPADDTAPVDPPVDPPQN